MAEFSVKTNAVRITADEEERIRKELGDIQQTIRDISRSLAVKTTTAAGIKTRLNGLAERVESHRNSMGSMKDALERAANLYEETERNICGYTEGGIRASEPQTAETDSSFRFDLSGLFRRIGEVFQGLVSSVRTVWSDIASYFESAVGKGKVAGSSQRAVWVMEIAREAVSQVGAVSGGDTADGTANGVVSGMTASGASKYKQPDYTQKDLAPDANGIYGPFVYHRDGSLGRVAEWNTTGQLSCTYYTLRKLNERGLSYACTGGPGNGNQWYHNFDRESGLPNYEGNNALRDLSDSLSLPQENIVVSFASGPALSDGRIPGHVLLIDEIYKDGNGIVMVKYSDMLPNITSLNGSNPQKNITLEAFMTNYNHSNGNINGVVVVGAGN